MPGKPKYFSEEPHYLPKYCGYLPQFKYRIGKTYGRHSLEILTDKSVKKSGNYVLTSLDSLNEPKIDERSEIISKRTSMFGNQNLVNDMLPGYTGYIPKRQHYFAKRYADVCMSAISHHENEQRQRSRDQAQLKEIIDLQTGKLQPISETQKILLKQQKTTPLNPINDKIPIYNSSHEFKPYGSPYSLENDSEMKWFKTGFTGFVPRTRDLIALNYKRQTNNGLKRFTDEQKKRQEFNKEALLQFNQQRPSSEGHYKNIIYPPNRGMVPKYTGYIPGYKYMIGHTYGHHTYNTMKLPVS